MALADVYDALTSERCYKKAFSKEKAMEMILDGQCGAFNPLLLECLKDIEDIIEVSLDMDAQMDVNPSLVTKVTEELLDSRIVEKASYSSWRLEKSRKNANFSQQDWKKFSLNMILPLKRLRFLNMEQNC